MHLSYFDYSILGLYFVFVIGMGLMLKRRIRSSNDFLMSGRSMPLWITSLAFISANLGAQEVIGMAASGAKYGIMTAHFYWVGAIPAMIFLGVFMMPFYYGSRARSVPEYLSLRFDEKTRSFNALSFAAMTIFSSGISLYALALLLETLLGWSFGFSVMASAGIVMAYTLFGGLTSAIYNEVLQFFLIVLGIAPVVVAGLVRIGGWPGVQANLDRAMVHSWRYLGNATANPMNIDIIGLTMGLGFVLSFGYWCTDFLVVQRAMVARDMTAAQKTPIIAAIPKLLMPFIVILPGLIAAALVHKGGFALPLKADGRVAFDLALPTMLAHFYPNGLLGVGLTALMASFMSGMAGNVTAFNSVFTCDIYQAHIRKNASDGHYLWVGRMATIGGVLLSIATAFIAASFNNIMDFLQLVFGFVNAPLFATFLLGMFWRRATGHGAFWGLISGTSAAALFHGVTVAEGKGGWLLAAPVHTFTSAMAHAFWIAIVSWSTCMLVTTAISLLTRAKPESALRGLVYGLTEKPASAKTAWFRRPLTLGIVVLLVTLLLNIIFF